MCKTLFDFFIYLNIYIPDRPGGVNLKVEGLSISSKARNAKKQLGVLGSVVSSPIGVRGEAPKI